MVKSKTKYTNICNISFPDETTLWKTYFTWYIYLSFYTYKQNLRHILMEKILFYEYWYEQWNVSSVLMRVVIVVYVWCDHSMSMTDSPFHVGDWFIQLTRHSSFISWTDNIVRWKWTCPVEIIMLKYKI